MNTINFGNFISELRKEKSLTQKQFADSLGITDKAVSRWETGKNYPDIEMFEKISAILGVSISELLECKRIPHDDIVNISEENVVKQIKKNKHYKKISAIIISIFLVISLILGYLVLKSNGVFDGVIYHNIDIYSNDALTVLSNVDGFIKQRPKSAGNYIIYYGYIFLNPDKTTNQLYLDGTTENGRYFYVNTQCDSDNKKNDHCFIGEFRKSQQKAIGISVNDLKSLIMLLNFSDLNENKPLTDLYQLEVNDKISTLNNFKMSDFNIIQDRYTYDNGIVKKLSANDVLDGNYLTIDLNGCYSSEGTPVSTSETFSTYYYKVS